MEKPRVRIYLIDDHPIVREGFARAIEAESDLEVVGQAATAEEGLAECSVIRPDVMLVDLVLPDRDGCSLIMALREAVPEGRLVVVSAHDDEYRVAEAVRAGAHGYLLKTDSLEALIAGVRLAAAGGSPQSPPLAAAVLRANRKPFRAGESSAISVLSAREIQVLRLFASGRSTREVAENLGISPKTVETHRVRIYEKLGCKSVVDLTRIAVRAGLVQA